jgi:hypothetical protein
MRALLDPRDAVAVAALGPGCAEVERFGAEAHALPPSSKTTGSASVHPAGDRTHTGVLALTHRAITS